MLDNNLHALINEPKSFVLPILPHMASTPLVPGEHYMLKYLPFYKITCLTDSEAHQAYLEKREEERQEGMLRQGPTSSRPTSSSTTRPLTKKKKALVVRSV